MTSHRHKAHQWAWIVTLVVCCLTSSEVRSAPLPLKAVKELWQAKLGVLITDLDVTPDGSRILVSVRSDADAAPAEPSILRAMPSKGAYTVLLDGKGKEIWRRPSKYPIKSQAISDTGDRAIVVTYDNRFVVYDARGKRLWEIESNCLPRAISSTRRIFCFHDDDLDPTTSFEVYDWNGKKLSSWKTPGEGIDLLDVTFKDDWVDSSSRANFAFAAHYSDGTIEAFGADGGRVYRASIDGEVLDLSFAPDGRVLALAQQKVGTGLKKRIVNLDVSGKVQFAEEVRDPAQQVLSLFPKRFVLTSNAKDGQSYRLFAMEDSPGKSSRSVDLVSQVKYAQQTVLNYPARRFGEGFVFVLEKLVEDDRVSQLSWIGRDGQTLADWPLIGSKGAYLYSYSLAPKSRKVVIAMDDGTLKVGQF